MDGPTTPTFFLRSEPEAMNGEVKCGVAFVMAQNGRMGEDGRERQTYGGLAFAQLMGPMYTDRRSLVTFGCSYS